MVLPLLAGAALRGGAGRAVRGAGRVGARSALMAARVGITGTRMAVAGGVAVAGAGINAARRSAQNSRQAQAQALAMRNSSSSTPIASISGGFGHLINNSFFLFGISILFIYYFSRIIESSELLIQNFFFALNMITPFNIQTTGMFATFDVGLLAIMYTGLVFIVIISYMFFRHKADGVVVASLWTIGYPFLVYFAFIGLGGNLLGQGAVEQVGNYMMMFTMSLMLLFLFAFLFSNDSEDFKMRITSTIKWLTIVLLFAWIALFLVSGTPQSLIFQERVDQEAQQVSEGAKSFQLYLQCTILAGETRNLPQCTQKEEETQVRRQVQEPFVFEVIRDSGNSVIRQGRETVQFNFFIHPPRPIDVTLIGYSCRVGTNRTTYEIPAEFSHLSNQIPSTGTNFRIECPVVDKLDRRDFQRGNVNVEARVYFEVKDTIHQSMPYVNCAHPYFESVDFDCSNIAREFWVGNIDNPEVLSFMNSVSDYVVGMYSTRGSVVSLRGLLPLYLNDPQESSFREIDYSIKFQEYNQLKIRNITLESYRAPDYITIVDDSLISSLSSQDMNTRNELQFPIEFRVNDVQREGVIGSTEIVSYNFKLNQFYDTSRTIIIDDSLKPEEEEPSTIGDIVRDNNNDSQVESSNSGEVPPSTNQQEQQTPVHEQGSEIDEETGEEIPQEEFDFENELVISP
ncbi:MAG: hypothetical protein LAT82_00560 [Nanoarchaeota archaeon]|nr:hypothetical protein [Nanoarchaeota archaeon]